MTTHDDVTQPVCCWQDILTGVMKLCDGILWCFQHLVHLPNRDAQRTHDEIMQLVCWQDTFTDVMKLRDGITWRHRDLVHLLNWDAHA